MTTPTINRPACDSCGVPNGVAHSVGCAWFPQAGLGPKPERDWANADLRDMHGDLLRLRAYDLAGARLAELLRGAADMLVAADVEIACAESAERAKRRAHGKEPSVREAIARIIVQAALGIPDEANWNDAKVRVWLDHALAPADRILATISPDDIRREERAYEIPEFFYPIEDGLLGALSEGPVWLWHRLWDHARQGWYDAANSWWKIGYPDGEWWGVGIFPSHYANVTPREFIGCEREVTLEKGKKRGDINAALDAIKGIADDYMTSEVHHPGYVLIPTAKFEQLAAAAIRSQPSREGEK